MSPPTPPSPPTPRGGVAHPEIATERIPARRPAWIELATSADHKVIGRLYIAAALSFGALALAELVLMRVQLLIADSVILRPEIFDQLFSSYGVTAAVLFGIPLWLGLISYVVPLQIGARGVALPRLAALSFWLYVAGGVTIYASFLYSPSEGGTTALPPLTDNVFSITNGVDAWVIGTGMAAVGFVLFAINLVATVRSMRTPGMVWRRLPPFSWAATVSGYLLLVIGPIIAAALAILLIDRSFGGVFYDPGEGGAPILYQHLSWLFFTGAYLLLILPAIGAISEILPALSGQPLFGRRAIALALVAIGALGLLAWMQNMYSAPIPIGFAYFAMAAAVALVIPVGVVLWNWIATLWGGAIRLRAPMLFALGAISTLAFGLAAELAQAVIPVGWQLGNTATAWGATHYALIGGSVLGGFAALHYWFPKLTGHLLGEDLGRASFWLILVGVHGMALPALLAGLQGQPVDIYKFFSGTGVIGLNLVSSIGSFVLAAGVVATLVNAARSARHGVATGHDPWGGETLEWFAPSPPPPHNFDLVPDVRGPEPLRDIREAIRRRTEAWRPPEPPEAPEPTTPEPTEAPAPPAGDEGSVS